MCSQEAKVHPKQGSINMPRSIIISPISSIEVERSDKLEQNKLQRTGRTGATCSWLVRSERTPEANMCLKKMKSMTESPSNCSLMACGVSKKSGLPHSHQMVIIHGR